MSELFKTSEITSYEIPGDNVIHQRLWFAYEQSSKWVKGDLLEIGCGAGKGVELFAKFANSYTAVDKNEQLIPYLQNKYPQHAFFQRSIPPLIDFKDESFDVVITQQVIEHIEDDHLFLKEIYRVLKPDGVAIITTPNKDLSLTRNPWHVREYTPVEMKAILDRFFPNVEIKGITGNKKIWEYYEKNKASVERFTRWDFLNLQYNLPREILQIPYDLLNRFNRSRLLNENSGLVSDVTTEDYFFTEDMTQSLDYFCIVRKK